MNALGGATMGGQA